jgi:acetylornithine deacetylase/succinyl-diaminopimelate desuccinylase-like protein
VPAGEYHGPGIGDCAAGLAGVTALAEALHATAALSVSPLLFVATTGEEGAGDLKGARALFDGPWGERIGAFVTVDTGAQGFVARVGTASGRFRVSFGGPGGHAWAEYGTYNPIHAAGDAIARIAAMDVPQEPRSSLNVGIVEGGRSVNAIPESASFDLDLRSVDAATLEALTTAARSAVGDAHTAHAARTRGEAGYTFVRFGDRPGGSTPEHHPLVVAALAALESQAISPRLGPGSTDANVPMSRGIPAIAFPWGGSSRGAHSVRESFRSRGRLQSVRALTRLALTYPTSSGSDGSAAHSESEAS